jgi:hypothetical protein
MSNLYILEGTCIGKQSSSGVQAVMLTGNETVQKVSFTGTAGVSAALNANTTVYGISADGIMSFRVGKLVTDLATTSYPRLAADQWLFFSCPPNSGLFISAITNT